MPQSHGVQSCGRADRARERAALSIVYLSALLLVAGCGVDDRTLRAGAASGAGSGLAGSNGTADDPAAGASGASDELVLPRCFYLGSAVESGCETLVENAGFGSNAASWAAEPVGISEGWLKADAINDPTSGSLIVMNLNYKADKEAENGTNGGGARQCVPVSAGQIYDLAADVFIPMGQGAGFEDVQYTSVATLSVFYYGAPNCVEATLSNFTSTPVDKTGEWVHIEGSTLAPKESQSMAVRLATLKPFRQIMFEAHFDNVFVRERSAP
jgi:hypothetical protein